MELLAECWRTIIKEAETIVSNNAETSIDVLIRIIKQINPTPHVNLNPEEKEKAYHLKSELQSLLLTNYGELFDLEPVQWDENIVLLKYKLSPFVDACHAKLHLLSRTALAQVRKSDAISAKKQKREITPKRVKFVDISTLNGMVEQSRLHVDNFEYDLARELLSNIRIDDKEEIPVFLRGLFILLDELGAFDVALELLFSLPKDLINDHLRETMANVCWLNNRFKDAKGIFEECVIKELGKESVFRYADIMHREGESRAALDLLNYADSLTGQGGGISDLRQAVCRKLKEEALPHLEIGRKAFDENNFDIAEEAARTALSICPEYDDARELIRIILAITVEDTVSLLWERYHEAKIPAERHNMLKQLYAKDIDKRKEILELIEKETLEEKKARDEQLISEIAGYLESDAYDKAFDKLYPLLKENRYHELLKRLSKGYPPIQCIVNNRQLMRLKQDEAYDCWLSYLQLSSISPEQETEKALSLLKRAAKAFSAFPEYTTIKDKCVAILAEKSRRRLQEYFVQLESGGSKENVDKLGVLIRKEAANLPEEEAERYEIKYQEVSAKLYHEFSVVLSRKRCQGYCKQIEAENITMEKAEQLLSKMKEAVADLPKEEPGPYEARCQAVIERLRHASNLDSFRKSLLCGDAESAELLKQQIHDAEATAQTEKEIASMFAVEGKLIDVLFTTNSDSHRQTKPEKSLEFIDCLGDEVFFNLSIADDDYLVILNINESIAWQYKMINFNGSIAKIILSDPGNNEYHLLCKDYDDDAYIYIRATLVGHNSRISPSSAV